MASKAISNFVDSPRSPNCTRIATAWPPRSAWPASASGAYARGSHHAKSRPAETAAEAAGIAFQLTNILRDLREDFLHGRIYLPEDELKRFGVAPDKWDTVPTGNEFRELMRFQVARADDYYRRAEPLERLLSRDGRAIFRVMSGVYRRLLREIADDPAAVFSRRIRVSPWRKCLILVNGWAMKRNWA